MRVFKDNEGKKSNTTSMLWFGFYVATFKLLMSGMTVYGVKFSEFTGSEYAIVLGAVGAMYQATKVIKGKFLNGNTEESTNK